MQQKLEANTDRVTITKFSMQSKDGTSFNDSMFKQSEIDDIRMMKERMSAAAIKAGREPPEFVLSVILIPNWDIPNNSYDDLQYEETQTAFMDRVHRAFDPVVDRVEDFYNAAPLTQDERQYLHQTGSLKGGLGSVADMLKTHSICDNHDRRHLNIDSNTKIANFDEFYQATFGAKNQEFLLNASYYDPAYVSTHNKLAYNPANSPEAQQFGTDLKKYCTQHRDNVDDKLKNSVYAKAFVGTAEKLGMSKRFEFEEEDKKTGKTISRTCYAAKLDHPAYSLSKHVVTAVNMSWSPPDSSGSINLDHLKSIPAIGVGHAKIDFQAIQYIIKKYTGEMMFPDSRKQLLKLANQALDHHIVREFVEHVKNTHPEKLVDLVRMIPDTPEGDALSMAALGVKTKTLHNDAQQISQQALRTEHQLGHKGLS